MHEDSQIFIQGSIYSRIRTQVQVQVQGRIIAFATAIPGK